MTGAFVVELPAFGHLSRNADSEIITFDDPLPSGVRIQRVTVTAVTRPLFYDLFGKGVVAGQRLYLSGVTPFAPADMLGMLSTFGPPCGERQAPVPHKLTCAGAPPRYAYGGVNRFGITNDYNPVDMGAVTLEFACAPA